MHFVNWTIVLMNDLIDYLFLENEDDRYKGE